MTPLICVLILILVGVGIAGILVPWLRWTLLVFDELLVAAKDQLKN